METINTNTIIEDLQKKLKIKVSIKTVYGVERIYPKCKISTSFSRLMRKKTFDREEIQEIKTMGYSVEVVTEKL